MRNMRIFGCPLRHRYLRVNPGVSETYENPVYLAHNPEVGGIQGLEGFVGIAVVHVQSFRLFEGLCAFRG